MKKCGHPWFRELCDVLLVQPAAGRVTATLSSTSNAAASPSRAQFHTNRSSNVFIPAHVEMSHCFKGNFCFIHVGDPLSLGPLMWTWKRFVVRRKERCKRAVQRKRRVWWKPTSSERRRRHILCERRVLLCCSQINIFCNLVYGIMKQCLGDFN